LRHWADTSQRVGHSGSGVGTDESEDGLEDLVLCLAKGIDREIGGSYSGTHDDWKRVDLRLWSDEVRLESCCFGVDESRS
jgi:hypothetical protein